MEAAIRASLAGPIPPSPGPVAIGASPSSYPMVTSSAPHHSASNMRAYLANVKIPPPPEAGGTRMNFRLPSSRSQRSFPSTATVQSVFAFALAEAGDGGENFELRYSFPAKILSLETDGGKTVEEMGMGGETVNMRWISE